MEQEEGRLRNCMYVSPSAGARGPIEIWYGWAVPPLRFLEPDHAVEVRSDVEELRALNYILKAVPHITSVVVEDNLGFKATWLIKNSRQNMGDRKIQFIKRRKTFRDLWSQ